MKNLSEHEPAPKKNDLPAVWDLVLEDIRERDKVGKAKYGTRLQPCNGRDALVDAYQEALDLVVYLRQAIYERDISYLAPDWERPHELCPKCLDVALEQIMDVVALNDDGWVLFLECPICLYQDDKHIVEWPFIRELATENEFKAIGVRVE